MKKGDLLEVKKMEIAPLWGKIKKAREELAKLALDKSMNKLTHPKIIRVKRKEIAQMLTILRQKQLIKRLEEVNG